MKKNAAILVSGLFLLVNLSGCAPLLVGAAIGGVTTYVLSQDTIMGDTDKPFDSLWDSAVSAATAKGTLIQENKSAGYIQVSGSSSTKIWIHLVKLTRTTTRIRISARKLHMPSRSTAEDLFAKILSGAG